MAGIHLDSYRSTSRGSVSATFFSIIVPVHNVRAYLRACLDSILDQSFRDFEVIAVDDASPDGSGEILDDYAAADDRVRVLHLAENVGLGPARNVGLDLATGRYLLFVDSDDGLTAGSLEALAKRLTETNYPDILLFDYARTYWWGQESRNIMAHALVQAGPDVFRAADRPDLLRVLMVVWNKAYRRDWVRDCGFRFPSGYYEDLPWTYPTLVSAERIAVLDRVCYHYRQRRYGNILRSRSRKHFDVLDQYARVFAYVEEHPELESWRTFLFGRMLSHSLMIMRANNRVHASDWREFFDRLVEAYERFRPPDYEPPAGRRGVKLWAIAHHNYAAFQTAHVAGTAIRRVDRSVAKAKKSNKKRVIAGKRALIRAFYKAELRKPIDENLAVYAAYWGAAYGCNPAAIYEKAAQLTPHIRGVWMIKKEHVGVIPAGVPYVKQGSPEYYRVMARAKYLINNVNFPDDIVKRRGSIHVQTNHGTPLKKMGLDLRGHPLGAARMNFRSLLKRCDRWDYLISSNRYSSEVWERAYPCDYVTLETGYPRNDRLVGATPDEVAKIRESLGLTADKIVVLYAPTFREWSRTRFVAPFSLENFCERLGRQYVVMVRGHYFAGANERLARLQDAGVLRDVSDYPVVENLMIASDVLLTDYSSIMFDYANLDRPIVIHANDWEAYRRVRGVNFDLLSFPPGVVETTPDGLVDAFTSGRYCSTDADRIRKEFRKRFCPFDDGHAAERVVRRVFLGQEWTTVGHAAHATGVAQVEDFDAGDPSPDSELVAAREGEADGADDSVDDAGPSAEQAD